MPYCRMYGGLTGIVVSRAITRSHEELAAAIAERLRDEWGTGRRRHIDRRFSEAAGAVDRANSDTVRLARAQAFEIVKGRTRCQHGDACPGVARGRREPDLHLPRGIR